ncbi:hypothetical protein [Bosea sp. BK604]|uniref:hypothetical protein n=1 Tax=Bosea sp. BK604 TaxID=2512180 RepID=UPI0010536FD0|nr:hypothetical protein [Bosea sp. BK604]TCR65553.1 hypothetical protein EV560_105316 [Bosea sp. BK604]
MIPGRFSSGIWRGLIAVTFAYVLLLQLVAAGVSGAAHAATGLGSGTFGTAVMCGGGAAGDTVPSHVEGTNTCCVWGMSAATTLLAAPPADPQQVRYPARFIAVSYDDACPDAPSARPGRAHGSRAPPSLG